MVYFKRYPLVATFGCESAICALTLDRMDRTCNAGGGVPCTCPTHNVPIYASVKNNLNDEVGMAVPKSIKQEL